MDKERSIHHSDGKILIGVVLIIIGIGFLLRKFISWIDFDYVWPLILIAVGVFLILRRRK